MTICIAAHTNETPPDGSYVGFINASEYESGLVRVIVRGESDGPGKPTPYASIDLMGEQWARFLARSVSRGSPELLKAIGKALTDPEICNADAQD